MFLNCPNNKLSYKFSFFETFLGKIIAQLECTKLCGGGRCKLKILVLDSPVISANMGKVISISDTAITVHHKFEEPLDYPITNPARMSFNIVFGLEQVNHRTLSAENVIFLPTKSENIDHITKEVQKFGVFEPVPIKWNDISEEAQKRISSRGNIYIQDQKYPASEFNLEYLEGGQLIDLLQTNRLELFKQENRHPEYVDRHFRELNSFEQMYSEDSLKVIKDSKGSGTTTLSHLFINSDNELFQIKRLSPYTKKITLLYDTSFDREYDKIKELAGNRSINLFEIRNGKLARFLRVIPERNIVEMNTNIVFISGAAGEGKSALMEHLRVTLSLPQTVVLHTFANKLLVPDNIFWPDAIRCFDLTDFEENVVKSLQIVLLIDGLDEVEATKFETALWNLYHLQHFQKLKVIVAVRSYLLDVIYEKFHRHLRATYCELRPLGTEGQVAIFTRYCKGVGESTAMQLMSTYQKYFNPTALQCRILGELYTDLRTSKTISDFVILDKLQLYQLVIERNFYWYFTEKIGFVGSKSSSPMFKHLYEEYKRAHIYLAAKYLLNFDADKLKGPLEHHNIELTAGQGLLDNVDEVSFTHRTFAEYFLDNWIYQVITGQMRLNEEFKSAFGELFGHFFVDWLDSDFLKLLLKQPWEPIYFDLPLVVLHCFDILNSSFIRQTPKILRKLIRSFRKYSPKIFEEDLRKLQSHKRYVYLRGYNGSEPELETNPYTISADLLVEWLCLDICPNMILDKFPDGFYMEDSQPKTVEDASKPLHIAGARLLYLPENSAKKEESEPVGWSLECFLVPYASEASGPRGSWVPNKKLIVLWRNPAQNPVFSLRHGATEKRAHKFQTSHPSLTFQTKKS